MYIIYVHLILSVFGLCILGVCWRFVYLCSGVRSHAFVYLRVFVCLCVSLLNGTRMPLFIEIFVYVCRYMALSTMCIYVSVASLFEVMSMTICLCGWLRPCVFYLLWPGVYLCLVVYNFVSLFVFWFLCPYVLDISPPIKCLIGSLLLVVSVILCLSQTQITLMIWLEELQCTSHVL